MVPGRPHAARVQDRRGHGSDPKGRLIARAYIAGGSNLEGPYGDREEYLEAARTWLAVEDPPRIQFLQSSRFYETAPVGGPPGQRTYLNVAWEVETTLAPAELLACLLRIEQKLGRVRTGDAGPRTIDLDLIFLGEAVVRDEGVHVPHPRAHERRFVLEPIAEIAPGFVHPVLKKTVAELLKDLAPIVA